MGPTLERSAERAKARSISRPPIDGEDQCPKSTLKTTSRPRKNFQIGAKRNWDYLEEIYKSIRQAHH
jgi:hypothetical protein